MPGLMEALRARTLASSGHLMLLPERERMRYACRSSTHTQKKEKKERERETSKEKEEDAFSLVNKSNERKEGNTIYCNMYLYLTHSLLLSIHR